MAVTFGPYSFPTQKAATEACQQLLYRYQAGQTVDDLADEDFLRHLLARHPEAIDKTGPGVRSFGVRVGLYGTPCFEIRRTDGSRTDFSFRSCITGKRPHPHQEVMQACRRAVADQIRQFRAAGFAGSDAIVCPVTGEAITREEVHVDHAPPLTFEALVLGFFKEAGIDITRELVTPPADNQFTPCLVDSALESRFAEYHRRHAQLRVISKVANLQAAAKHQPGGRRG